MKTITRRSLSNGSGVSANLATQWAQRLRIPLDTGSVAGQDHWLKAGKGSAQAFEVGRLQKIPGLVQQWDPPTKRQDARGAQLFWVGQCSIPVEQQRVNLKVNKVLTLSRTDKQLRWKVTLTHLGRKSVALRFGSEWNLECRDPHFNRVGSFDGLNRLSLTDAQEKFEMELVGSKRMSGWFKPVETLSTTARGQERSFKHLSFLFYWDLKLEGDQSWSAGLKWTPLKWVDDATL